jgi:hypothetical protein
LVRENDIIFTEVDADLSMTREGARRLRESWSEEARQSEWREAGFVDLVARDEQGVKLRAFDAWGWYLDIDVYVCAHGMQHTLHCVHALGPCLVCAAPRLSLTHFCPLSLSRARVRSHTLWCASSMPMMQMG